MKDHVGTSLRSLFEELGEVKQLELLTRKKLRREEPSRSSLREIPEIDFTRARPRPNSYAARITAEGRELLLRVLRAALRKRTR